MAILESDQPEGFLLFKKYFINNLKATRVIYPIRGASIIYNIFCAESIFLNLTPL